MTLWWYLLPVGSILLVVKFYWDLGKYANDFIRFGEEYRQAQIVNPNYGGSSSSSREELFVAIQSLSKDDMRALLYQVLEHNPLILQIDNGESMMEIGLWVHGKTGMRQSPPKSRMVMQLSIFNHQIRHQHLRRSLGRVHHQSP